MARKSTPSSTPDDRSSASDLYLNIILLRANLEAFLLMVLFRFLSHGELSRRLVQIVRETKNLYAIHSRHALPRAVGIWMDVREAT